MKRILAALTLAAASITGAGIHAATTPAHATTCVPGDNGCGGGAAGDTDYVYVYCTSCVPHYQYMYNFFDTSSMSDPNQRDGDGSPS